MSDQLNVSTGVDNGVKKRRMLSAEDKYQERSLVGHIGGLGPRKGALNFAQAIPPW